MAKLYNVSIINKHDVWLEEDEENPLNWVVMSEDELETYIKREISGTEKVQGRAFTDYDDIVGKKFL